MGTPLRQPALARAPPSLALAPAAAAAAAAVAASTSREKESTDTDDLSWRCCCLELTGVTMRAAHAYRPGSQAVRVYMRNDAAQGFPPHVSCWELPLTIRIPGGVCIVTPSRCCGRTSRTADSGSK